MSHPPFHFEADGVDPTSMQAFRAFKRAMMLHRRLLLATFADTPMHPAQASCLQALGHRDGMSQSDLAELLHVSRPSVTTMLQRLEAGGTIERRPDSTDSRITRVYLTDEGRTMAERMHDGFVEMLTGSMGSLSDDDKRELTRILTGLNDRVEDLLVERGASATPRHHFEHEEGTPLR